MDQYYDFEATSKPTVELAHIVKLIYWLTEQKIEVISDNQTAA
jgi:hypothetical protein